jgi:hypothetical protein
MSDHCFLLTDCVPEKILKKLMGRKDIEDALSRLDMLTKEENLMVMMRNLEVTHHIDAAVRGVDGNVKATKLLTEDIDGNVKASMVLTEDINDNVNATKAHIHGVDSNIKATKLLVEDIDENVKEIEGVARGVDNSTQRFLSVFMHIPTFCPIVSQHSHARA